MTKVRVQEDGPCRDLVAAILDRHGLLDAWEPLPATGVANWVYATRDVVLRVATDHSEAVADARTESVAAPIARAAGLLVPKLLVFDDSRTTVDRPYSIWERVHGQTLGLIVWNPESLPHTWRTVGQQLARLHRRVHACPDPSDWLDRPERVMDLQGRFAALASVSRLESRVATQVEAWIGALQPAVAQSTSRCFLHYDIHEMNVMCTPDGSLLAILDWGDAGWGDPVLEFTQIPLSCVGFVMDGYGTESPAPLGDAPEARIIWDKLAGFLEDFEDGRASENAMDELRVFVQATEGLWRT
jgi:aminoglycoside phosphotransferase (APT) family kinase protein